MNLYAHSVNKKLQIFNLNKINSILNYVPFLFEIDKNFILFLLLLHVTKI